MTEATHYELQIEHPVLRNGEPQYAEFAQEDLPPVKWWQVTKTAERRHRKLMVKRGYRVSETEVLPGSYRTLSEAQVEAKRVADERTGQIHAQASVDVVEVRGRQRHVVDGYYPEDGGRIG